MSDRKIIYRLELAVEKIDQVFEICKPKGVTAALEDELLAKPAIMKHIDVVYQQFKKLEEAQEYHILDKFKKEDIKGIRDIRNWSSHNYDNIQNEIIEDVIRTDLPNLKENFQKVIKETKQELCEDLQKKIDRFIKKQNILTPQAKSDLGADIQKGYNDLRKNGLELDKSYADKLKGTIQNDILKEYAARGTYIFPPRPSMRLITNIFEYCSKNVPNWNTISISGYHIREAGSTASQEIAFTIADGIAYVEAAIKAGLSVDDFAGRLSFFWNAHNNVLEEVAKFRASRRIWAKVMKERFKAEKPKSMMLRVHTQTAGSMLTAQQPNNNIVRVALQTAAAVMGGTQSLHTNSRDEALALPTEDSVMVALRTQQIVAYESGLADVIDPLAGSYYVEAMTNRIEAEAWEYIKKIDDLGGAVAAIEKGYIQKEIQDSAYKWQMDVESGARVIVGVNKFQVEEEAPKNLLRVDASVGEKQKAKVEAMKAKRDNAAVQAALADLKAACGDENENLMPHILAAVKTYATLGEICGVMREVFGEYEAHVNL